MKLNNFARIYAAVQFIHSHSYNLGSKNGYILHQRPCKKQTFCFGMEGISITDEFLILASGFREPEYLKRSKN
jgi:hypothetical protein